MFRWLYFGDWLPNTYYAKQLRPALGMRLGWQYILRYLNEVFWVPVIALGLLLSRRAWRLLIPGALWVLALLPLLRLGGDWMPYHRFCYHAATFEVLLWCGGIWALAEWLGALPQIRATVLAPLGGGALAVMLLLGTFRKAQNTDANGHAIRHTYRHLGHWLHSEREIRSAAMVDIGAIAYFARVPIIDLAGLTDRFIARRSGMLHEKRFDARYVLEKRPSVILLHTHGPVHWFHHRKALTVKMRGRQPVVIDLTKQPYVPPGRMFLVERNIYFHPTFRKEYSYVASLPIRRQGKRILYTQTIYRHRSVKIAMPLDAFLKRQMAPHAPPQRRPPAVNDAELWPPQPRPPHHFALRRRLGPQPQPRRADLFCQLADHQEDLLTPPTAAATLKAEHSLTLWTPHRMEGS